MLANDIMDGVALGIFMGIQNGKARVVFAGNPRDQAIDARTLVALGPEAIGSEVALLFEDGRRDKPLIIGRIINPELDVSVEEPPEVVRDGDRVQVNAQERLELRCGKAVIIMENDGHITIRGTYLVSHASASNRIRGGSVNLN